MYGVYFTKIDVAKLHVTIIRKASEKLITADPELENEEWSQFKNMMLRRYSDVMQFGTIS